MVLLFLVGCVCGIELFDARHGLELMNYPSEASHIKMFLRRAGVSIVCDWACWSRDMVSTGIVGFVSRGGMLQWRMHQRLMRVLIWGGLFLTPQKKVVRRIERLINAVTAGNPYLGTKLLEISMGRCLGVLKGLSPKNSSMAYCRYYLVQWHYKYQNTRY